jgi:hypothetical protein
LYAGYVNINLPPYSTAWPTINAFDAALPNNAGRFSDIYVQRPMLNSHYNAAIVQYQHVFSNGFQFMSNYTWGQTVSDYPWINNLQANGQPGFPDSNTPTSGTAENPHSLTVIASYTAVSGRRSTDSHGQPRQEFP